jgi:hypothetical protein
MRLHVFDDFTYTIETLIQAGFAGFRIVNVPVSVNSPTRPSRLFSSNLSYICKALRTIVRTYFLYCPGRVFRFLALAFLAGSLLLGLRYVYFMIVGEGAGHIQSAILVGALLVCSVFLAAIGLVTHLQTINRRLLEEILVQLRLNNRAPPGTNGEAGVPFPRKLASIGRREPAREIVAGQCHTGTDGGV